MKTETIDTLSNVGSKLTATGLGTIGLGWLTAELALGITGALATLLGLLVNFHYKRKASKRRDLEFQIDTRLKERADQRLEEWQKFRMEMARAGVSVPPATDFGALAPMAGPWADPSNPIEDDEDER